MHSQELIEYLISLLKYSLYSNFQSLKLNLIEPSKMFSILVLVEGLEVKLLYVTLAILHGLGVLLKVKQTVRID